jgi:hypothetical protein
MEEIQFDSEAAVISLIFSWQQLLARAELAVICGR